MDNGLLLESKLTQIQKLLNIVQDKKDYSPEDLANFAEKYKSKDFIKQIDWNKVSAKNSSYANTIYDILIRNYETFLAKNDDPLSSFRMSGLTLTTLTSINLHQQAKDGVDFVIIEQTKHKIWLLPLTYEACKFANSKKCGNAMAEWCTGIDIKYFNEHVNFHSNMLLLEIDIDAFRRKEAIVKWMWELSKDVGDNLQISSCFDQSDKKIERKFDLNRSKLKQIQPLFDKLDVSKRIESMIELISNASSNKTTIDKVSNNSYHIQYSTDITKFAEFLLTIHPDKIEIISIVKLLNNALKDEKQIDKMVKLAVLNAYQDDQMLELAEYNIRRYVIYTIYNNIKGVQKTVNVSNTSQLSEYFIDNVNKAIMSYNTMFKQNSDNSNYAIIQHIAYRVSDQLEDDDDF